MRRFSRNENRSGRKSMREEELEQWQDDFDAFHARFADLFERSESREQARKYLRGLLTEAERKNSWQVAVAMLEHAWEQGVPMRWVTGDEVYGDSPRLRETIQAQGRFYVLAVSANTRVWTERPEVEEPAEQTGGRPRRAPRVAKGAPKARMVSEVIASLPKSAWKRLAVVEGEKGMITYSWARVRVVESRDQLPGPDVWLLARRSLSTPDELAYYLAYAPPKTSLETLVRVASTRYTVEECIEEAKGETGLDEYEVRFWHSWYRHITLSMMAHAWLASIKLR